MTEKPVRVMQPGFFHPQIILKAVMPFFLKKNVTLHSNVKTD